MKYISPFVASALACLISASSLAQNGEDTVVLLPEGAELPDVVTASIDLPKIVVANTAIEPTDKST